MNQKTRNLLLAAVAVTATAFAPLANAAAGWTDFGNITELNQNPPGGVGSELLFVRAAVTPSTNTSGCSVADGFYLQISTDFQKRLFSILMVAKASGSRVRLYFTGNCHTWGYAEMMGVVME